MGLHFIWLNDSATPPTWLEMEQEACQPFSLGAILLSPYTTEKSLYNCSVVIHSTVRIWKQIKSHFKMEPIFYALPIAGSPTFAPSYLDNTFILLKIYQFRGFHSNKN